MGIAKPVHYRPNNVIGLNAQRFHEVRDNNGNFVARVAVTPGPDPEAWAKEICSALNACIPQFSGEDK